MKTLPFLLEIGTEEIPDWMIQPALKQLGELFEGLLAGNKLDGKVTWLDATPRRLVLKAEGLPQRQPNSADLVTGPPKSAGEGAAAGFARKLGVEVSALKVVKTAKGEYLAYRKKVQGRRTLDILAEALPGLILKIYFPKTMYWTGKGGPRFIRPIRWMVALLGTKVVPFELAGVKSGNVTTGHRQLGKKKIRVTIDNYEQQLRENCVFVSAAERKAKIESEIRVQARSRPAQYPGLPDRVPDRHRGQLRPTVSEPARRGSDHRDAAPPEVLLRGGARREARAALRRGDEHQGGPRRAGPEGQRARAARPLQRRPLLLGLRPEEEAGRPRGRSRPRDLAGATGFLPGEDQAGSGAGAGVGRLRARAARGAAGEVRPHHRDGEGVHRTARRGGRPLRARARRARGSLAGDLRPLQAGEHGGFDPRDAPKGGWCRWPTSSTRCAAVSGSA